MLVDNVQYLLYSSFGMQHICFYVRNQESGLFLLNGS